LQFCYFYFTIETIKQKQKINSKNGISALFKENPLAVIVITPIMRRSYLMKAVKEIIFVDSWSARDPLNHSIAFIVFSSDIGTVPLAIILAKG
jgi:hypothetical protein